MNQRLQVVFLEPGGRYARVFLEKPAEMRHFAETQLVTDFLIILISGNQQAAGFEHDALVDDLQWVLLAVAGKQIRKRFGRTIQQVGVFRNSVLLPEIMLDQQVELPGHHFTGPFEGKRLIGYQWQHRLGRKYIRHTVDNHRLMAAPNQ